MSNSAKSDYDNLLFRFERKSDQYEKLLKRATDQQLQISKLKRSIKKAKEALL